MTRTGWHILTDAEGLTLARRLPVRWDVWAEAIFPIVRPLRLAQQVRQDLWRLLARQRGFSPVIRVTTGGDGLVLRAGGQVAGPVPSATSDHIAGLLADPDRRQRWIAHSMPKATP